MRGSAIIPSLPAIGQGATFFQWSHEYDCINEFLRNEEERASFFKGLRNFGQFVNEFYANPAIKFDHNDYYSVRSIEKDGHTVVVTGLNSAWLSREGSEQGRLLLGEQQVCDAGKKGRDKYLRPCLHIVLVHHPIYWLAEKDVHRVRQHLPRLCDLLLRGHLHCPSYFIQRTPDWHMHEFAAGASWKAAWHSYNFVKLSLDSGVGSAIVRFQHPQLSIEWKPDVFTYRHMDQGRIRWKVKLRK